MSIALSDASKERSELSTRAKSNEITPTRLFPCTPSRLASFDCPRRYRFTYLDRPTPPRGQPWAHNTVGATAHLALHSWWLLPRDRRTPHEGARLVERHWQSIGFRDDKQSAQACADTAAWVRQYLAAEPSDFGVDPDCDPIGVERTVATRTERLAVSGRVDRVDDRDGELVVVDYKTGRREPTEDDARGSQALALYVLGVRRTLRRDCHRVELHHLPSGTVAAFEHTEESLERQLDRAERTAQDVVAATDTLAAGADPDDVFPAVPSSACAWCDFRQQCPEGQAASPDLDSWAGLAQPIAP
ncbi:MAG: putative RecB family exonuclease [Pseudonocardiales bacterium]|nr:putative RecB family exonuclease [Pseudonocardiales bacterium]